MRRITLNIEQIHINVRLSHPHKALNLYKIKQDFVLLYIIYITIYNYIVVFIYLKIHVLVACSKKRI